MMRKLLFCAAVLLAGCGSAVNVDDGSGAGHVETSACTGDAAYCDCVQAAEVSGMTVEDAQQACSQ